MSLTVWWTYDDWLSPEQYPSHYDGRGLIPVIRLADLREVTVRAQEALDRIANDPTDMEIRSKAEVACFYAMQQLLAQLKGVNDEPIDQA